MFGRWRAIISDTAHWAEAEDDVRRESAAAAACIIITTLIVDVYRRLQLYM